jgi:hypothetical protein
MVGDVEIGNGAPDASKNGFRDTGLGGAVRGDRVGEAARLRNGLLDDKLSDRPDDRSIETSCSISFKLMHFIVCLPKVEHKIS